MSLSQKDNKENRVPRKGGAANQENVSMLLATFQTVGQAPCIHAT